MTTQSAVQLVLSPKILRQSVGVALVVGTILVLINQGDVMFSGGEMNWLKVALTFMVPFFVSLYGAWNMARMHHEH